ncbi:hypothetical protein MVEN_02607500 [Mycena venus]|uniref:Uncharacterized protein n=1 Tax=Mycena venus TaxID=2733690 RepID=A0A8H6WU19_9AGAR|nr:hypothetical protein MVEN_02607500 [Mycena venus]
MPWNTPAVGKNWGIEVNLRNADGDIVYDEKRKPKKTKIKMADGFYADGTPQAFYFGPETERPGVFTGMAVILKERGHDITYTDHNGKLPLLTCESLPVVLAGLWMPTKKAWMESGPHGQAENILVIIRTQRV